MPGCQGLAFQAGFFSFPTYALDAVSTKADAVRNFSMLHDVAWRNAYEILLYSHYVLMGPGPTVYTLRLRYRSIRGFLEGQNILMNMRYI